MIICNHLLLGGGKINNLKKVGKNFLSQLLCISAIFGTASCNDDQVFNQTDTAPLQVSVNAQGTQSLRAIIHGEYLPDGSSIGVSLTNEDGGLYDNTEFFNLQYTASGESNAQTWSSDEYASLSTTIGKVTAYYPYNPDITDWTKIPVETASQTDYMYAKPVTGLNIVSSTANLLMQHALTDIRVCIQKGSYTGTGAVTKITAKAPAFATNATMSAVDGTLAGVTGGGTQFETELTDAAISAADVTHDFLVVPLASSTSGEVTIFVTIDGKKFTVNVPYTEAFQQGYSYVYNLTLDNEALTFKEVKVDEWGVKAEYDDKLQFYDDQYIVEIKVPSNGYTYGHNIDGFIGTIDWGDGTKDTYTEAKVMPSHTYTTAGDYIIIAEGKIKGLDSYRIYDNGSYRMPTPKIKKIINIGKDMGITNMVEAFYGQNLLSEIVPGAFNGCTQVTSFNSAFRGCTGLTTIPKELFDYCTKVKDYKYVFYSCKSLAEIPNGLFDNCTEVTDFTYAFANCYKLQNIPEGLFDHCTKVSNFNGVFRDAEFNSKKMEIVSIPVGLFDYCTEVTSFDGTFAGCSALTSIPEGLFDNCTKVTSFELIFKDCSGIQFIPSGLFDKCTEVMNFGGTFANCISLESIPEGLFKNNTKVTTFMSSLQIYYGCFTSCIKLKSIPEGLFDNCTEVTEFGKNSDNNHNGIFSNTAIGEIPEGLFDKCTKVISFNGAFSSCDDLTSIPEGLFDHCTEVTDFRGTFQSCTNLQSIPEGLFDYNTKVTNFSYMFYDCKSLTTIPEGLFDKCSEVSSFSRTFYKCLNLQTIPAKLFDNCTEVTDISYLFYECRSLLNIPGGLFDNNRKVTDFGGAFQSCVALTSIPVGLFNNCTEVTSFYQAFAGCTSLQTIPERLFDKCTKVTDFYGMFWECSNLTGESPYTIINVNGEDVKVHLYERSNYPEYFTAPTSYSKCFYSCTGLTDYSLIPSNWL